MILFYSADTKSKTYGNEIKNLRLQLDETLRIENYQDVNKLKTND